MPKYPDVKIKLTGKDGNAFVIISRVRAKLRAAGHADVVDEFTNEAMSGDYDHVLRTCMDWVRVR